MFPVVALPFIAVIAVLAVSVHLTWLLYRKTVLERVLKSGIPIRKRVCVIGAGPAGLSVAYFLKQDGCFPVILERQDSVGGVFARSRYVSFRTNTPKEITVLAGMKHRKESFNYLSQAQVLEYLETYAVLNKLEVRLHCTVVSVEKEDNGWVVFYTGPDAKLVRESFDAVVVSTGQTGVRHDPSDEYGVKIFCGRSLHYEDFSGPGPFINKRVLVVGSGTSSASDICNQLSCCAEAVIASIRDPVHYFPLEPWERDDLYVDKFLGKFLPSALKLVNYFRLRKRCRRRDLYGDKERYTRLTGLQDPESPPRIEPRNISVDHFDFMNLCFKGLVSIKPGIQKFSHDSCFFKDGTSTKIDAVVWCTGYRRPLFHGFEKKLVFWVDGTPRLFDYAFSPEHGSSLAFTMQQNLVGATWTSIVVQSAYISQVISNHLILPTKEDMERESKEIEENNDRTHVWGADEIDFLYGRIGIMWRSPFSIFMNFLKNPDQVKGSLSENFVDPISANGSLDFSKNTLFERIAK